jgi:hypothetical protein
VSLITSYTVNHSHSSSSSSSHLGLALGISLGVPIAFIVFIAIRWWWWRRRKARNVRASNRSKHPSTKGSKGTERSASNHNVTSSPSQVAFGPSVQQQAYNEFSNPRTSSHSTSTSVDQATMISHPPAYKATRLAPRDAHGTSGGMGGLIEMLNDQRIGPTNRKGKMTSEDILEEEGVNGGLFLPNRNDSTPDLERGDHPPRIPSIGALGPLDLSTLIAPIPINETSAQYNAAKPTKPKPSIVARGISATPAVYAPVTRARSTGSRHLQSPIVPRHSDADVHSPPMARGEPSPLAEVPGDMHAQPDSK